MQVMMLQRRPMLPMLTGCRIVAEILFLQGFVSRSKKDCSEKPEQKFIRVLWTTAPNPSFLQGGFQIIDNYLIHFSQDTLI